MMRLWAAWVVLAVGCGGETGDNFTFVIEDNGRDGGAGSELVTSGVGGDVDLGGAPGDGGASEIGGAPGIGGDVPTGSGGQEPSTGGAVGSGGVPATGGAPSGGSGSGGAPEPVETVLWSWAYDGFTVVAQNAKFVSARIYLGGASNCPVSIGVAFEPGDSGVFEPESTYDMSCADTSKAPLVQFGYEWNANYLPSMDYSDPNLIMRLTLHSFTASEWPVVGDADVDVSMLWEIVRVE